MLTFIVSVLLLFLIPGPAVLITISQTLKNGKKQGIITGLGIGLGDLVHTIAAILGLSVILMSSAIAFEVVKYIGAAYLVYLGVQMLISKKEVKENDPVEARPSHSSLRQGFLTELLNPKTALFFVAFFPQFIKNDSYPVTVQLLLLGLIFLVMTITYTTLLAYVTHSMGDKIFAKTTKRFKVFERIVGFVYIGLAVRLALQSQE